VVLVVEVYVSGVFFTDVHVWHWDSPLSHLVGDELKVDWDRLRSLILNLLTGDDEALVN
jgi:hypothetical protein